MGVRIDDLTPSAGAARNYLLPAMLDGATVRLTVGQILDLLIGSAPGTLDTLQELADAINDDNNYAVTVAAALALKANKSDTEIHTLTAKATPVDADELRLADSAAAFGNKRITLANLKAFVLASGQISKFYESPEQTITNGGQLTLAHGLGVAPKLTQPLLICKTADIGYAVGDLVAVNPGVSTTVSGSNHGHSLVIGATNLLVRYGQNTEAFMINRKDTGAATTITQTNWRYIVRAWA